MIAAGCILVSCDQENVQPGTDAEEEETLEAAAVAEDASDDALDVTYQAEFDLLASMGGRKSSSDCPVITHDHENKTFVIDFGDHCVGPRGRVRSGKIIVNYSHELGDSIANRIITFENFFVNNKGVEGTIELRDVSINEEGHLQSTKRLIDLTIIFPNGKRIVFNGSRTREWLSGFGDCDRTNNVFRITGSLTGVSNTGRSFTYDIVVPIISDWSCAAQGNFARISGIVEMTKLGGYVQRKRIVDYGDGECDNVITIITIKKKYTITVD
jgi:hypothetical protein